MDDLSIYIYAYWIEMIIFSILLGVVVGMIASKKGYDFLPWFLYGTCLFVVALPHILINSEKAVKGKTKECPYCFGIVNEAATACKYCGKKISISKSKEKVVKEEITSDIIKNIEPKVPPEPDDTPIIMEKFNKVMVYILLILVVLLALYQKII